MNKCSFIGRLGRDAESKTTGQNTHLTRFSIAVDASWKDRAGAWQKKTTWVNCVIWGENGHKWAPYLTKGTEVFVEGNFETYEYEKNGNKVKDSQIKINIVKPLASLHKQEHAAGASVQGVEPVEDFGPVPEQSYDDIEIPF